MAGPINGLGSQQLASQVSSDQQSRQAAERAREDQEGNNTSISQNEFAREPDSPALQAPSESESANEQNEFQRQIEQANASEQNNEAERGSIIDITV